MMGKKRAVPEPEHGCLSSAALKWIAVVCMTLDHAGYLFAPPGGVWYLVLRTVGKLAMPIYCFLIAEGYFHTRSVGKYALRLALSAAIAHAPFSFFLHGGTGISFDRTSVFFTLLCGLLALWAWNKLGTPWLGVPVVAALSALTFWSDWSYFGVLFVWAFGAFRKHRAGQLAAFAVLAALRVVYQLTSPGGNSAFYAWFPMLGLLLAVVPLALYSGKRGAGGKVAKWAFYAYYPAHLLALALLFAALR